MKFFTYLTLLLLPVAAQVEEPKIDIVAMTGNDEFFNSDGGGLTASFLLGAKVNDWTATLWGGGYTPEYWGKDYRTPPTDDSGPFNTRITGTLGQNINWRGADVQLGGYIGADGLNRVGESVQCNIHDFWGTNCPDWPAAGNHNHVIVGGYALWQAPDKRITRTEIGKIKTSPFAYASVGTAHVQGGGGWALDLVWDGELPLPAPDNGLYGIDITRGQGIRAYIGTDIIAYDHILEHNAKHIIPHAGIMGQARWGHIKGLAEARCRAKPYNNTDKADCATNITFGLAF